MNEAWRRFGVENALNVEGSGVGLNYFDVCAAAQRTDAPEAQRAADGIRSVLNRTAKEFSIEYASHSPTEQRWFLMNVTPLRLDAGGAVVVHADVTKRRLAEGHFPPGSMGPKIQAAIEYIEAGGREVLITSASHLKAALANRSGTKITASSAGG